MNNFRASIGNRSAHLQDACGRNYDARPTISGTGVALTGYRSTCFIRTGQHALIPKTFAEGGSEKLMPIRTDLPPSIARVPLPL
jgi:hypothetical protein